MKLRQITLMQIVTTVFCFTAMADGDSLSGPSAQNGVPAQPAVVYSYSNQLQNQPMVFPSNVGPSQFSKNQQQPQIPQGPLQSQSQPGNLAPALYYQNQQQPQIPQGLAIYQSQQGPQGPLQNQPLQGNLAPILYYQNQQGSQGPLQNQPLQGNLAPIVYYQNQQGPQGPLQNQPLQVGLAPIVYYRNQQTPINPPPSFNGPSLPSLINGPPNFNGPSVPISAPSNNLPVAPGIFFYKKGQAPVGGTNQPPASTSPSGPVPVSSINQSIGASSGYSGTGYQSMAATATVPGQVPKATQRCTLTPFSNVPVCE